MNYWNRKEELKKKAIEHTKEMESKYMQEIGRSIGSTKLYDEFCRYYYKSDSNSATFTVCKKDSVSALFTENILYPTCILNFASYKNPGGKFIDGSSAQEESLCHESTLYSVLKRCQDYYNYNKVHINKGIYTNRALYSKDIVFLHNGGLKMIDVLTCAAPNYSIALKYGNFTEEENLKALESRIEFVVNILKENKVETAILGAWGCGVFKQDAKIVAKLWQENLKDSGMHIIHPIPDDRTYNKFLEVYK